MLIKNGLEQPSQNLTFSLKTLTSINRNNTFCMKVLFSKQEKIEILETAISWLVVFMMLVYGTGKIMQFNGATAIEKTLPELTAMELMWAFYGYSFPFAVTIGLFEILGAIILFFKRTRIIGCFVLSTILANIIIQDIVFEVNKGALYAAILYQVFIFIILWMNKTKVIAAITLLTQYNKPIQPLNKKIIRLLILVVSVIILFFVQHYFSSLMSSFH